MSKLLRRSGAGVTCLMSRVNWVPDLIVQSGIGLNCHEIEVFEEVWPDVALIGFDPNPTVKRSIGNTYWGKFYPIGLSDKPGKATMYVAPRHRDGGSLYPFKDKKRAHSTHEVELTTLDLFFPDGPPSSKTLLWLDCEGHELHVLRGAENFLKKVEVVNVEMTGSANNDGWVDPTDVHDCLTEHGFHIQWSHTQRAALGQNDLTYVRPHLFKEELCNCPWAVKNFRSKHSEITNGTSS